MFLRLYILREEAEKLCLGKQCRAQKLPLNTAGDAQVRLQPYVCFTHSASTGLVIFLSRTNANVKIGSEFTIWKTKMVNNAIFEEIMYVLTGSYKFVV